MDPELADRGSIGVISAASSEGISTASLDARM
jgi:hypothetical protein